MSDSLGATPEGAAWCLKALHPSDAAVSVSGVPDESSMSTVMMNYQTIFTIEVPPATGDGWSADIQLTPHPVQFARFSLHTEAGAHVGDWDQPILNSQLAGLYHVNKYDNLTEMAVAWRLVYFGVTAELDAPTMANQGSVAVCQKPVKANVFNPAYTVSPAPSSIRCGRHLQVYNADCVPSYEVSQAMPNSYVGLAKEGAYVPVRLSRTSQKWVSCAESVMLGPDSTHGGLYPVDEATDYVLSTTVPPPLGSVAHALLGAGSNAPYFTAASPYTITGTCSSPLLNDYVADICFRNLSVSASIKLFFRVGIEMLVPPLSPLSSQLRVSPEYDPRSFEAYFHVSRRLKDAYPSDYNSADKLWEVIEIATRAAAPMLRFMPGYGPPLAAMLDGAGALARYAKGGRKSQPSAVEQQAAAEAIKQKVAQRQQVRAGGSGPASAAKKKKPLSKKQRKKLNAEIDSFMRTH